MQHGHHPCPNTGSKSASEVVRGRKRRGRSRQPTYQGRMVGEKGGNVAIGPQAQQDEVAHREVVLVAWQHSRGQANHAALVVGGRL
eukprot:1146887-Pelagomonas_calceolata.AAC.3